MQKPRDTQTLSHHALLQAIQNEGYKFQETYLWLERSMPSAFFQDISQEHLMLISHSLMGFNLQSYFATINLEHIAIILCVESPDADLKILQQYAMYGIKNFQAYVSKNSLPFEGVDEKLRIGIIYFTEAVETIDEMRTLSEQEVNELHLHVQKRNPELTNNEFEHLIDGINTRFLQGLPLDRIILAFDLFVKAKSNDHCCYEVRYNEDWETNGQSSIQIVMAWKNTPKHHFLYLIARTIHLHNLVMRRVHATYIEPYSKQNILIMVLGIHGASGKAAWDEADIPDFLRELIRIKYFPAFDTVYKYLIKNNTISGNMGNLIRSFIPLVHQFLLHIDPNFYTPETIEETYCRHPDLTLQLTEAFKLRFNPEEQDLKAFENLKDVFIKNVNKLDTGHEHYDLLRKNVLILSMNLILYTLKTNFYRPNLTAIGLRIDPNILDCLPYDRELIFPTIPYGIFYIKGMHFFGFHVRFKDLSRGGLRTVNVQELDRFKTDRNLVFTECYNLALTQHHKNKEIPEGGSKGIIFLKPFARLEAESKILKRELEGSNISTKEAESQLNQFRIEQREEYLHAAQRSYIETMITLVNCHPDGTLIPKNILDYWKKPEYLYIGPDENMSNEMIDWISNYSKKYEYKPGSSFISSKPLTGINHKEYGATSLGINVYMEKLLQYIDINPFTDHFTIKLSGGPDGDVAGNMILNFKKYYPKTAKVIALTDVSGTIQDMEGLDLEILSQLFEEVKPISHYPPEQLSDGGFLIDTSKKRSESAYVQQTLCYRKEKGKVLEEWLSGSETNNLVRHNMHKVVSDVFITAGGRPKTLNEHNWKNFLTPSGEPSSKIIIEGANLYITTKARFHLEEIGVLIVKDSSANKTGVICSSFEVLSGLTLGDSLFIKHKEVIVSQILEKLKQAAEREADLLIESFDDTGIPLSEISAEINERMNHYKYEILDYLEGVSLSKDENHPLNQILLDYSLPFLKENHTTQLIEDLPDVHKKAIMATHIAALTIYQRGLSWSPSIVDVLPIIFKEVLPN